MRHGEHAVFPHGRQSASAWPRAGLDAADWAVRPRSVRSLARLGHRAAPGTHRTEVNDPSACPAPSSSTCSCGALCAAGTGEGAAVSCPAPHQEAAPHQPRALQKRPTPAVRPVVEQVGAHAGPTALHSPSARTSSPWPCSRPAAGLCGRFLVGMAWAMGPQATPAQGKQPPCSCHTRHPESQQCRAFRAIAAMTSCWRHAFGPVTEMMSCGV